MKYKAIIFDLDGVICHTDEYHYKAWKKISDEIGIYFDREINNRLRGVSRAESFEIILEKYDGTLTSEQKNEWLEIKNNYYKEYLEEMTEKDVTKEVVDTLNTLREKGLTLAIGSSSKNARFILGKLGITELFKAISDGNNITNSKPDPEVFIKAAEMIHEQAEYCLVVEDAVAGVEAAIAAKMDSAAIGDATNANIATTNLHTFSDLLKII